MLTGKKTMKINIIALIIILGICSIHTGTAFAADMEQRQEIALDSEKDAVKQANDDILIREELQKNTNLTNQTSEEALGLSSEGNVISYDSTKNPLGTKLVIPESKGGTTITGVKDRLFMNKGLTEVVLPNTLTNIGEKAFENNSITKVIFPSNDFTIGRDAFASNAFTEITIPSSMKTNAQSSNLFASNNQLKKVVFEEGVSMIASSMFKNCPVEEVTFPNSIKTINNSAFFNHRIKNLTLSNQLETIGSSAFYGAGEASNLTEVIIPNSVTTIMSSAFENNQLPKVVLSNQLSTLGTQAFMGNQISEIEIPGSLKQIPSMAFYKNELKNVIFHKGVETLGWASFANNQLQNVILSEGITSVESQVFANNKIEKLTLPSTLTKISAAAFGNNRLSFVELPQNVVTLNSDAFTLQQDVPAFYIIRENKYIYQLPKEMDMTKVDKIFGFVETDKKDIEINTTLNQVVSDEALSKITYEFQVSNGTISSIMDVSMKPQIKKHHVILKDFDNTVLGEYDIEDNQALENVPAPSRAGYTFIGWDYPTSNIQEDLTITAQYKQFPVVEAKLIRIEEGSNFNPKDYIVVKDADGNNVQAITITKNNVDVQRPGKYAMEFKATDIWGGEVVGVYQVEVYSKVIFEERRITDKISGISIEGSFVKDARVIVELTPVPAPSLNDKVADKEFINAFEVRVLGEYRGKLKVKFPLDKKLNGTDIYIYHEKKDGTIEEFKKSASGGAVEIMVDELSPFVLAKEKVQKPDTKPDTKPGDKPGATPTKDASDGVQTGDQRNAVTPTIWLLMAGLVILVTLRGKYTKS